MGHLLAALALTVLVGCAGTSAPDGTEPPPKWCPHIDEDSGQRYYLICDP